MNIRYLIFETPEEAGEAFQSASRFCEMAIKAGATTVRRAPPTMFLSVRDAKILLEGMSMTNDPEFPRLSNALRQYLRDHE